MKDHERIIEVAGYGTVNVWVHSLIEVSVGIGGQADFRANKTRLSISRRVERTEDGRWIGKSERGNWTTDIVIYRQCNHPTPDIALSIDEQEPVRAALRAALETFYQQEKDGLFLEVERYWREFRLNRAKAAEQHAISEAERLVNEKRTARENAERALAELV